MFARKQTQEDPGWNKSSDVIIPMSAFSGADVVAVSLSGVRGRQGLRRACCCVVGTKRGLYCCMLSFLLVRVFLMLNAAPIE